MDCGTIGSVNGRQAAVVRSIGRQRLTDELTIEDYWRGARAQKFVKLTSSVADRRARDVRDVEMGPFASCLHDSLDGDEWRDVFELAIPVVAKRVRDRVAGRQRYLGWIAEKEALNGTPREKLLAWRVLEILIERDLRKGQRAFDFQMGVEELQQQEDASVEGAAEPFAAREFKFPYYYGLARLACLASSNIEQFLMLAGDAFEECVSAALLKRPPELPPQDQERILRRAVRATWRRLPDRIAYATQVMRFLEGIAGLSQWETYKPNAPYAPGVTGIAIAMSDRDVLRKATASGNAEMSVLAQVIASCIAHNLLEVHLDQKCKGQYWMIMYLNRMLCMQECPNTSIRHLSNMNVEPGSRQQRRERECGEIAACELGAPKYAGLGFFRLMPRAEILQKGLGILLANLLGVFPLGQCFSRVGADEFGPVFFQQRRTGKHVGPDDAAVHRHDHTHGIPLAQFAHQPQVGLLNRHSDGINPALDLVVGHHPGIGRSLCHGVCGGRAGGHSQRFAMRSEPPTTPSAGSCRPWRCAAHWVAPSGN